MIPAGAGLGVWGVYRMRDSLREEDYSEDFKAFRGGLGILVAGTIVCTVGIIFAIKSGKDKSKSKEAMEELKRDMALSFAISNDGLGLVLRF